MHTHTHTGVMDAWRSPTLVAAFSWIWFLYLSLFLFYMVDRCIIN